MTKCLITVCALMFATHSFAQQGSDQKCGALTATAAGQFPNQTTVITTTAFRPASAASGSGRGAVPALPQHCDVRGRMKNATDPNGQHTPTNFQSRWLVTGNGNFFSKAGAGPMGNFDKHT